LVLSILACASTARAQSLGELWGNVTIDWLTSERLVDALDIEPKVQVTPVTGQSRFANVDITHPLATDTAARCASRRARGLTAAARDDRDARTRTRTR
jgi:hypothetical protein